MGLRFASAGCRLAHGSTLTLAAAAGCLCRSPCALLPHAVMRGCAHRGAVGCVHSVQVVLPGVVHEPAAQHTPEPELDKSASGGQGWQVVGEVAPTLAEEVFIGQRSHGEAPPFAL